MVETKKRGWDWFETTEIGGKPWLISAKDEFWTEAIDRIEEVARILRDECAN